MAEPPSPQCLVSRVVPVARFVALVRADFAGVRAGFVALLISSGGDLVTGLTLASITNTLSALPGLLILIPAAIGMRGNVFGGLGSRLGTQIHAGTFRLSRRIDTLFGQNVAAAIVSSISIAGVLAVLAEGHVGGVRSATTISRRRLHGDLGGRRDHLVDRRARDHGRGRRVLRESRSRPRQRRRADRHRAGDIVTLPSLFLATYLVGFRS